MKKTVFTISGVALATMCLIGLCSFVMDGRVENSALTELDTHTSCEGKHCTYSVGCDCPGFSPITDGKEWQKAYCKHCKHKKSYHK